MKRVCALCGRETDVLIEGLCPDCYRKTHPLARVKRDFVGIVRCPMCGSINYRGRWVRDEKVIKKLILESIEPLGRVSGMEIEDLSLRPSMNMVKVTLRGSVHDLIPEYTEPISVSVRYTEELCPRCRDLALERERAVLQVRSLIPLSDSIKNLVLSIIRNEVSRSAERGSIVDINEVSSGFDVKFTDQGLARAVAYKIHSTIPSRISESQSVLRGRGERTVTKLSISLILVPINRGSVVMVMGKPYYVLGYGQGTFKAVDLKDGIHTRLKITDMVKMGVTVPNYDVECVERGSARVLRVIVEGNEYIVSNAC
ncbi:60S ribosomal export protein NMD3 [Vulcanisaeta thermophila]|uniref:60S ribosomal export protein NMD3 n=1 Tax=Vulcanisaeta thermophila TaxID=867917 RepID=UPI000852AF6E|nr:60S ribosomal export protein NMD3 [Vulcanisaeta thermophila]